MQQTFLGVVCSNAKPDRAGQGSSEPSETLRTWLAPGRLTTHCGNPYDFTRRHNKFRHPPKPRSHASCPMKMERVAKRSAESERPDAVNL